MQNIHKSPVFSGYFFSAFFLAHNNSASAFFSEISDLNKIVSKKGGHYRPPSQVIDFIDLIRCGDNFVSEVK